MPSLSSWRDEKLCLTVDIGSSGVRCKAYALARRPRGTVAVPDCEFHVKAHNVSREDGTADLNGVLGHVDDAVDGCLRLLRSKGLAAQVIAVGFASFSMNFVGVDGEGKAVTPVLTYASRSREAAKASEQLRKRLSAENCLKEVYQRTGAPIHTAYAPAQLAALAASSPSSLSGVRNWQTISSAAVARWTGPRTPPIPVSFSEASWTGLLNFRTLEWDSKMCAVLHESFGFDHNTLPKLADFSEYEGTISGVTAARWPELKRARLFLGVGDGAAANVGSGCISSERVAVTVGTSAAVRVVLDSDAQLGGSHSQDDKSANSNSHGSSTNNESDSNESWRVPEGLWCYRVDRRRLLVGGALTDGGSVFEWVETLCSGNGARSGNAANDLAAAAAALKPASHSLTFLPFLSGERSPGWNDEASGVVLGLRRSTEPHHLLRAALEAVALRLAAVFDLVLPLLPTVPAHSASGAAATTASQEEGCANKAEEHKCTTVTLFGSGEALHRSSSWRQIISDALGTPLVASGGDHTTRGVADLISQHLLGYTDKEHVINYDASEDEQGQRHEPDGEAAEAYKAARQEQEQLYKRVFGRNGLDATAF